MLHANLQNNSLINALLDWWNSLSTITGISPTWMLVITCFFIALILFFSGSIFSLFAQSLVHILRRKD